MAMQLSKQEQAELKQLQSLQAIDAWTKEQIVGQILSDPSLEIDAMYKKVSSLMHWFNAVIDFARRDQRSLLVEAFTQYRCNVGSILTNVIQWDSFDQDLPDGSYQLRNVYYVYLNQNVKLQLDVGGSLVTDDRASMLCLGMGGREGLVITPETNFKQFKKTPLDEATFLYLVSQYLITFSDGRPAPFLFQLQHAKVKGI